MYTLKFESYPSSSSYTRIGSIGPFRDSFDQVNLSSWSFLVGGKPVASAQFLLNPDSSARAI
jgi:hypothetical protein